MFKVISWGSFSCIHLHSTVFFGPNKGITYFIQSTFSDGLLFATGKFVNKYMYTITMK